MLKSIFSFFWLRHGSNPGPPPKDTETNEDGASVASDDNGTSPPSPPLSRSIGKRPRVDGTPGRSSLRASGSRRSTVATPKGKGVVFAPQPPSSRKIKPLPRRRPKKSKYWTYVSESSSSEEPSPSPTKRKTGHDEEDSDYEPVSPHTRAHTRGPRTTQPTTQPARAVNRAIRGDGGKDDEPRPAKRSRFDSVVLPATHMTRITVSDRSPRVPSALRRVHDTAENEVPSPRRGRGRPPKDAGTLKKEDSSTPSRPRGRPPKEDIASAGPSSGLRTRHSLPSKVEELRRGQPRHARPSLPMIEVMDDPAPETEEPSPAPVAETPRRGRGRPRKSEPVPHQPSAGPEPEAEAPRRGRGRPRKSEPSLHDPPTESESEPGVEVEAPRRGRGRPRKSEPSLHQPLTQPEPEVEVPRRGRGRPRKSEPTFHDPEPDGETPRRGRGRPRKIVSASAPASPATPRRRGRPPKPAAAPEAEEEPNTPRRRGRPPKTAVAASEPRRSGRPHQPTKYWTYETVSSSSASP